MVIPCDVHVVDALKHDNYIELIIENFYSGGQTNFENHLDLPMGLVFQRTESKRYSQILEMLPPRKCDEKVEIASLISSTYLHFGHLFQSTVIILSLLSG